jgi:hypothetical protein
MMEDISKRPLRDIEIQGGIMMRQTCQIYFIVSVEITWLRQVQFVCYCEHGKEVGCLSFHE